MLCSAPMAEWTPELELANADVAVGHAGPVVAHFWYRHVTVGGLERLQQVLAARRDHAPLAVLTVIDIPALDRLSRPHFIEIGPATAE